MGCITNRYILETMDLYACPESLIVWLVAPLLCAPSFHHHHHTRMTLDNSCEVARKLEKNLARHALVI
jgi:hypothetical protein